MSLEPAAAQILSAPALIKEYNLQVYNERFHIDENGNETVSEKMARKEISTFKEGLKHVNFYRN